MSRRLLPLLVALSLAATAHAAQLPEPAKKDKRIRFATYDPYDVVTIYAGIGKSTTILFAPGEKVVDMVGGDSEAWGLATTEPRDGVFLKPTAVLPDADLQVHTNKRKYSFDLKLARPATNKGGKPVPGSAPVTFMRVHFRYPTSEATAATAEREAEQVRALLDTAAPSGNRRYSVEGSSDLAPIEVWDDGRTTFMRFRARGTIPAVYGPRGDGDDNLDEIKNVAAREGVLEVPGVKTKFVLRVGRQVACVFNEAYDPNAPRPTTNTASPLVKRTVKGAAK
jgi:type IV secretion system protein VirB9